MKKLIGLTAVASLALLLSACWWDQGSSNNTALVEDNATIEQPAGNDAILDETSGNATANESADDPSDGNSVGGNAL